VDADFALGDGLKGFALLRHREVQAVKFVEYGSDGFAFLPSDDSGLLCGVGVQDFEPVSGEFDVLAHWFSFLPLRGAASPLLPMPSSAAMWRFVSLNWARSSASWRCELVHVRQRARWPSSLSSCGRTSLHRLQ
jgi:hypothetical protein